jgi:hypothetical protein
MNAPTASEGSACADEENEEEGHEGCSASEGEEATPNNARLMSPSHRTGLAKLPSVVEWLAHALGRCAGHVHAGPACCSLAAWILKIAQSLQLLPVGLYSQSSGVL